MAYAKTLEELGRIIVRVYGIEQVEAAYGVTDLRAVGQAALHYHDITETGALT